MPPKVRPAIPPPAQGPRYAVACADVLDFLSDAQSDSYHGMLTDPPYGLEFMGREWDRGVPPASLWRETLRVLKPGSFGLVFGGTRTWHRLAVALEDAGFEIRDTLMWLYGSGFPKSHNLQGAWKGYGTTLKPAWEPILLVRKPTVVPFAESVRNNGTGALNIDGARIGTEDTRSKASPTALGVMNDDGWQPKEVVAGSPCGRWPANLILDEEAGELLDEQTGTLTSGKSDGFEGPHKANVYGAYAQNRINPEAIYGDSGGASRFYYCAKASPSERNAGLESRNTHPTVKPLALTRYLATLLLPRNPKAKLLVPFSGSGSEMIGAVQAGWPTVVGIEKEAEYAELSESRLRHHSRVF